MLYDITPAFSPHFKHPYELLMERLGNFPRAERRVIDLIRHWLTRPGGRPYLTITREWLANAGECCVATVSRAFARARETGVLDIQLRWRKRGNLRRQISNIIRLPFRKPPELIKCSTQTRKHKKRTLNKVASGPLSDKNTPPTTPKKAGNMRKQVMEHFKDRGWLDGRPK